MPVRDGGHEQATQAVFAAAVKNCRLLGDFMDMTMREQKILFAEILERCPPARAPLTPPVQPLQIDQLHVGPP